MSQVEQLEIEVRQRLPWEAADLGCRLLRQWPVALYGGWLMTAVPVFALVALLLRSHPGIAGVVLWWLKPIYERLPMWLLRQKVLGMSPTLRDVRPHWRALAADLAAVLIYRRLSLSRSFDAPVAVFENLPADKRRARRVLLHRGAGSQAVWLTIICAHVETFIVLSAITMILLLVPDHIGIEALLLWLMTPSESTGWISNLIYLCAIGLVGPLYVSAGFTLYLNRRIEMEGWDIELGFRRLTTRLGRG